MFLGILSWFNGAMCGVSGVMLVYLHNLGYVWVITGDVLCVALLMFFVGVVNGVVGLFQIIEHHGGMGW